MSAEVNLYDSMKHLHIFYQGALKCLIISVKQSLYIVMVEVYQDTFKYLVDSASNPFQTEILHDALGLRLKSQSVAKSYFV